MRGGRTTKREAAAPERWLANEERTETVQARCAAIGGMSVLGVEMILSSRQPAVRHDDCDIREQGWAGRKPAEAQRGRSAAPAGAGRRCPQQPQPTPTASPLLVVVAANPAWLDAAVE